MATTQNIYFIGNEIQVSAQFTNSAGTAVDPTTVACAVTLGGQPLLNQVVYGPAVVRTGTGAYYALFTPPTAGTWYYTFTGSGSVIAAAQNYFVVSPAQI